MKTKAGAAERSGARGHGNLPLRRVTGGQPASLCRHEYQGISLTLSICYLLLVTLVVVYG